MCPRARDHPPRHQAPEHPDRRGGRPRLIDFGLARLRHAWSDGGDTDRRHPAFMAPEQARSSRPRVGPRSDVFGPGGTALLPADRPGAVRGGTAEEVWDRARRCDSRPRRLRLRRAPRRLERICLKAMAADPAERYATAEALPEGRGAGPCSRARRSGPRRTCRGGIALLGVADSTLREPPASDQTSRTRRTPVPPPTDTGPSLDPRPRRGR